MSTTRATVLADVAGKMFSQNFIAFVGQTGSDNTATAVAAEAFYDSEASARVLSGGWLYVHTGVNAGEARRIASVNPTLGGSYGTANLARQLPAACDSTSEGFAYAGPVSPDVLVECVNEALRAMRRERRLGLTLVEDGAMEATGVAAWTATSAALSKVATAASVYEGAQALLVDNSGADGQAASAALDAEPGETLRVEAVVRITNTSGAHTATLVAYDATNAAVIDTASTTSRLRTCLRLAVAVPDGCYQVQLLLRGSGAATDAAWDEVLCWRPDALQLPLPADLTDGEQVVRVVQRRPVGAADAGVSLAHRAAYPGVVGAVVVPDPTGATPLSLDLGGAGHDAALPVLVDLLLPWPELATDAATTAADRDDVVRRARLIAYERLAEQGAREETAEYKAKARDLRVAMIQQTAYAPRPAQPVGRRRRAP